MNFRLNKSYDSHRLFMNALLGRGKRRGHALVTFERVLGEDPDAIRRCIRPILSLDHVVETEDGQLDSLGDRLDPAKIIEPKIKTIDEQIHERDVEELVRRTREQIKQSWPKLRYKRGLKAALKVFDGLCRDDMCSEIARELDITREAVRQIRESLVKLPAVKRMKQELRLMRGGE